MKKYTDFDDDQEDIEKVHKTGKLRKSKSDDQEDIKENTSRRSGSKKDRDNAGKHYKGFKD